jgi:uncharacterized damage-inducible protein DinB
VSGGRREAHSIWEIVLHIAVWEEVVRRRLAGEIVELSDAEDWPSVNDTSAPAWEKTVEALEHGNRQLREAILNLSDARLDDLVPGKNQPIYFMLHGVIQHDLYHAGQIAVLKKARQ